MTCIPLTIDLDLFERLNDWTPNPDATTGSLNPHGWQLVTGPPILDGDNPTERRRPR